MRKEAEVHIEFDRSKIDMGKLHEIEKLFLEMGIHFDTGASLCAHGARDWEWDWSLRGPVKVFFVRFVEDNPENRYEREKNPKQPDEGDQNCCVEEDCDCGIPEVQE